MQKQEIRCTGYINEDGAAHFTNIEDAQAWAIKGGISDNHLWGVTLLASFDNNEALLMLAAHLEKE